MRLRDIATLAGVPPLARTRSGVEFNPQDDVWSLRDGVTDVKIDWSELNGFSAEHLSSMKATMVWYAAHGAPTSLRPYFISLREWIAFIPSPTLSPAEFFRFRNKYKGTRTIGLAKSFLRKWSSLSYPGLSTEFVKALAATREKGPVRGVAVATLDPHTGPLTDIELQGLQAALTQAYAERRISLRDHVLAWLFIATGARPIQLASMKVMDVHRRTVGEQHHYDVDVPRAKQRNGAWRAEFKNRPLIVQVGRAVYAHAQEVRRHFESKLTDPTSAALFPQFEKRDTKWTPGFEYHATPSHIGQTLRHSLFNLNVQSERTGAKMNFSPIRFRRTLGTRAAQEGHGVLVIAELLDHTDTQHVGVYVATRPDLAERIDKPLALELAPLAQAFKGKLVQSAADATRGSDSQARIRDLRFGEKVEGFCGQHGFCGFNAPIACYTCNSFEPWIDGPHEAVLESLLAKRDRQLANGDKRVAAINDRTILAVAEVARLCRVQLRGT